jgi:xylulokinase
MSPPHVARAAVEGLLCGLADGVDALVAQGARVDRVLLVGGGAASEAIRRLAPGILGVPVHVPPQGEYVARGAARQAAWCLAGGDEPPAWVVPDTLVSEGPHQPQVRERYREANGLWLDRLPGSAVV